MAHGSRLGATALNRDSRRAEDVGRRARLELRFACHRGQTVVAHAYAEPPFRVGRSFHDPDGGLHMILASSAPGVFGGDAFETTIHVEPGARVRLTSQSALQAHPSRSEETAVLRSRYVVGDDATLRCVWDPLIPFAAARLDQRFEIEIASSSRLYWSDAFMAGREARGERWRFASLSHELRLTRSGRLDYVERFRIDGKTPPTNPWAASVACYFGSILASSEQATADAAEAVHACVAREWPDLRGAADLIDHQLLLVRLMSADGPAFHRARRSLGPDAGTVVNS